MYNNYRTDNNYPFTSFDMIRDHLFALKKKIKKKKMLTFQKLDSSFEQESEATGLFGPRLH